MRIGQADVDFEGLTIVSPAGQFTMESKVMRLLRVLVDNPQTVMTRSNLIEAVWGVEFGGDERLSRGISLIRKALGDSRGRHDYIETIPRRGYRFIADIPIASDLKEGLETKAAQPEAIQHKQLSAERPKPEPQKPTKNLMSKKSIYGIAASLLVICLAGASFMFLKAPLAVKSETARVERGLEHVKYYTHENAIETAQSIFTNILSENPDNAAARAGLSLALMREYTDLESDPAILRRAKSSAEAALRNDSHLGLANVALGWAKELEGDLEGAHKAYDRADILDPDNMFMLEGLARTYNKQRRGEDAKATLERAISLYPDAPVFYAYSGLQLLGQNEYAHAESMFRHVITLSKEDASGYARLAHTLHMQDRTTEAIKVLQDGLKIDKASQLYNNLGTYLFFQGQFELSAEAFEKTLELDGNSHKYLYWANLADAYRFLPSRKKEAGAAYDQALTLLNAELEKSPTNRTLNSRAALYKAKRGDLEGARVSLGNVPLELNLSSVDYYRALVTYEILSERDNALAMLKKALQSGYPLMEIKNDPELAYLRQDKNYHLLLSQEGKNL